MVRSLAYLTLLLVLHAGATELSARSTCGERGLIATELSSPLLVDPEDEQAILAFIDGVTPLPVKAQAGDLERILKAFWSRYRPDLDVEQLDALIGPHRPAKQGLANLRTNVDVKRRPEAGRLRLTWMAFIGSAFPAAPAPEPATVHRAEALALNQKSHLVLEYLRRTVTPDVQFEGDSAPAALRHLYRKYLPGRPTPPLALASTGKWHRGLELVALWRAYVDTLVPLAPLEPAATLQSRKRFDFDVDGKADPSTVPEHPRAMLEYLMKRYPDVVSEEPRAIWKYVRALRDEWELGPSRIDIPAGAAVQILRRNKGYLQGEQLMAIWQEFLRDRRRTARTLLSSPP